MSDETQTGHPYETLTPDLVMDAVEHLGYTCDARVFALNSYENRVYQVGIEEQAPLIAKFYRPERWSNEQILEEHRFSQALFDLGVSVVPPSQLNESTLHEYAGFRFALYPRQGGHAPTLDNFDHLLSLGRALGRIHALGQVSPFAERPELDTESFAQASYDFLLGNDFIPQSLIPAYETLGRDLIERCRSILGKVNYQRIRLHGDCHPGNILWRDDTAHFVDFDDARNGPAIQDLWMLLSGDRPQQTAQLAEILEGYQEFCDFDSAELLLIEALRTLRLMHYAGWLARRWHDPAFPHSFPWFNTERYWAEHILELREQLAALDEPALSVY
ncbi:serine/threonine protein kinase [Gilvimarinus agarilyticus]|uniref:serine/threonine protein kinase n=1 Tax=Gilvimarinus sp. 2_MG-2023 TaxID=3062666 RepID=UPI001C08F079|nr:serine/threonine protein kinase [Gilvimarinus sp. 2_MG-2023]MBU2885333.1 serine/threonine protein kinase [Gilvimarinus agarilyticus]MDO6570232.1 serine/threonine protein kinase [Gilvimarinus sp. 2_MG-2023]